MDLLCGKIIYFSTTVHCQIDTQLFYWLDTTLCQLFFGYLSLISLIREASYSSKAQNMTCTVWLLGCKYFVHFSGRRLFAYDMEKMELRNVMKWRFCPISFHCMLCCFDSESKWWIHISSWITSCEINFAGSCRYHSRSSSETCVHFWC